MSCSIIIVLCIHILAWVKKMEPLTSACRLAQIRKHLETSTFPSSMLCKIARPGTKICYLRLVYIMIYTDISYHIIPYRIILYYINIILYFILFYYIISYHIISYYIILYYAILYYIILYYIILYVCISLSLYIYIGIL